MRRFWVFGGWLFVLAGVCLICLVSSCGKLPTQGDDFTLIKGLVFDKDSHKPIDSAWVAFKDTRNILAYADTGGAFVISTWAHLEGPLYAGRTGYLTSVLPYSDLTYDTAGLVFELEKMESR